MISNLNNIHTILVIGVSLSMYFSVENLSYIKYVTDKLLFTNVYFYIKIHLKASFIHISIFFISPVDLCLSMLYLNITLLCKHLNKIDCILFTSSFSLQFHNIWDYPYFRLTILYMTSLVCEISATLMITTLLLKHV